MIILEKDLIPLLVQLKRQKKKIVTTNGAFDLFHAGHVEALTFAKAQGDILIVLVNSDTSIKSYKSRERPVIPENERTQIVDALRCVDYVLLFDDKTPIRLLDAIQPAVHVKGSEYETLPEKEVVEQHGGTIVFLERDPLSPSTSKIIEYIRGKR